MVITSAEIEKLHSGLHLCDGSSIESFFVVIVG